jgi:hypothetical protein
MEPIKHGPSQGIYREGRGEPVYGRNFVSAATFA